MTYFHSKVPGGFFGTGEHGAGHVSIRANNPGAINGGSWEKKMPGFVGNVKFDGKNDTTIFETPEDGVTAWVELLRRYRVRDITSVGGILIEYGGGQENYEEEYLPTVMKWTGFARSKEIKIDGTDDVNLLKFAKAMFRFESGENPIPWSDAQITYGFRQHRKLIGVKEPQVEAAAETSWWRSLMNLLMSTG